MKKNTLFHHKKFLWKSPHQSRESSESKQLLQNSEIQAKFSLLEISEEVQKNNNRALQFFQNHHARSYSTQFFSKKRMEIDRNLQSPENTKTHRLGKGLKQQIQQSVTMKSTFSNEMRRTQYPVSNHSFIDLVLPLEKDQKAIKGSATDSLRKLRKINYLPFTLEQHREIENIDQIFKTAPSKQILAILKRMKIGKQIRQNEKNSKQKIDDQTPTKKKSIFNIRHLMLKQKIDEDHAGKREQIFSKRAESPDKLQPKELHSTNRNVIKMRMKNRYNKTSISKRW